ncbi:DUF2798 domain-containing protein [Vreelandella titanicae]
MIFPRRFSRFVFPLVMSVYMVTIMTFVITWANTGLSDGFLYRWWTAFYIAWPVAFSLTLLGASYLQKIALKMIK